MIDLTVLYLSANKIPDKFAEYQRSVLKMAVGDYPVISLTRKSIDFGTNVLDFEPQNYTNIYRQMLRGAKLATTDFVAVAEDDVLYQREHFSFYRPAMNVFAYNQNRWALFTWGEPTYSMRNRVSNCSLIAPRKLLIEALEERFAKYPVEFPKEFAGELGRARIEYALGVTPRNSIQVFSETSIVQFNHIHATEMNQVRRKKNLGQVKAYDIPYWGKAEELVKIYQ